MSLKPCIKHFKFATQFYQAFWMPCLAGNSTKIGCVVSEIQTVEGFAKLFGYIIAKPLFAILTNIDWSHHNNSILQVQLYQISNIMWVTVSCMSQAQCKKRNNRLDNSRTSMPGRALGPSFFDLSSSYTLGIKRWLSPIITPNKSPWAALVTEKTTALFHYSLRGALGPTFLDQLT